MIVLVTGGAGFIPSHIVDRLLKEGHKVTVLDLWQSEESKVHIENPNFKFIKGDVLNDDLIAQCMEGKDRAIHMAAVLGSADTITTYDVEKVGTVNIVGTTKILKAAKKAASSIVDYFVDEDTFDEEKKINYEKRTLPKKKTRSRPTI